jgi:hypothetical protein
VNDSELAIARWHRRNDPDYPALIIGEDPEFLLPTMRAIQQREFRRLEQFFLGMGEHGKWIVDVFEIAHVVQHENAKCFIPLPEEGQCQVLMEICDIVVIEEIIHSICGIVHDKWLDSERFKEHIRKLLVDVVYE